MLQWTRPNPTHGSTESTDNPEAGIAMSVSVCASVREHIAGTTRPSLPDLSLGSVVLRRCNAIHLPTSGFMDDVMFARNVSRNMRCEKSYTQSDSTGGGTDLTPRRIHKLAKQVGSTRLGAKSDIYCCLVVVVVVYFIYLNIGGKGRKPLICR